MSISLSSITMIKASSNTRPTPQSIQAVERIVATQSASAASVSASDKTSTGTSYTSASSNTSTVLSTLSSRPCPSILSGDSAIHISPPNLGYPIQGTKLRVFDLQIPDRLKYRFEDLHNQYGPALYDFIWKKHSLLGSITRKKPHIDVGRFSMKWKYLGETEATAQPYIVILCAKQAAKKVKYFFRQEHVVKDLGTDFHLHIIEGLFKLGNIDQVEAFGLVENQATLCGKRVHLRMSQTSRWATVGGTIMVTTNKQCALFGLIAGHPIYDIRSQVEDGESSAEYRSDMDSESGCDNAEDTEEDSNMNCEPESLLGCFGEKEVEDGCGDIEDHPSTYVGKICHDSYQSEATEYNHDWALIDLQSSGWLPNMLNGQVEMYLPENPSTLTKTSAVAVTCRGIQFGILTQNKSAIFLAPGKNFVPTMDFSPVSGSSLRYGDSGSWVVDQDTGQVYGHLIALDVFGEGYVVPIQHTLKSIQMQLHATKVCIPSTEDLKRLSSTAMWCGSVLDGEKGEKDIHGQEDLKLHTVLENELSPVKGDENASQKKSIGLFQPNISIPVEHSQTTINATAFALTSSTELYTKIRDFKTRDKEARALKSELGNLTAMLQSLLETTLSNPNMNFDCLELPLYRCGSACKEYSGLISQSTEHPSGLRSSNQDWVAQTYLQGDITDFKDMMAGYRATISIALANADIRRAATTTELLKDYSDMISDTSDDLEKHLKSLDTKTQNLFQWQAMIKEKRSIQQGFETFSQISTRIEQLQPTSEEYSPFKRKSLANRYIKNGLEATKRSIQTGIFQLQSHNDDIDKEIESMGSATALSSDDTLTELTRLRETKESINQCIKIISAANEVLTVERQNVYEDITLADDAYSLTVSTMGHLVTARRINLVGKSRHIGEQISDKSYQKTIDAFAKGGVRNVQQLARDTGLVVSSPVRQKQNDT